MIEIEHLIVSYDSGHTRSVDDVSLNVAAGEFLALVGASGCGKTSLLKSINRLIAPAAGSIRIDGRDNALLPAPELRRGIGYVFQATGLFPHLSIAQNIAITPKLLGWPREAIDARVKELLDLVQLPQDFAHRFPAMLSGGQQQRVGIARALAARPKILLMDEPFGALDAVTRDKLGQAIRALHDAMSLTTIMVTHDIEEALLLADTIAMMDAGRIIASGTPRDLAQQSGDPRVMDLMDMPRRRTERLGALIGTPQPDHSAP